MGWPEAKTSSKLAVPLERDFAEQVLLRHHHGLHPHHLQDRQEQRDHGPARALLLEDPEDEYRLVLAGFHEPLAADSGSCPPPSRRAASTS